MERYVLEAFQKGIIAAVAASTDTTLAVKYIGRNFTPPDDAAWLEPVYIPNNIEDQYWGTEKTYQGVMRLVLHCPQTDKGVYSYMDTLQSILDYFTKGIKLEDSGQNVKVTVTETPNILSVLEEPPEILIPASIRYSFFSS